MWPNHAPYLAPRLEQGKAIQRAEGKPDYKEPPHLSIWPRDGESPEFSCTPGQSQEQSCMVDSGQQASDNHATLSAGMMQKRMNVRTPQTLRGQNQVFAVPQ